MKQQQHLNGPYRHIRSNHLFYFLKIKVKKVIFCRFLKGTNEKGKNLFTYAKHVYHFAIL